ncbi:hypothetical protein KO317_03050 [Candidatus Micrarchaeota archaeon]|jgi:uncharacterized protein (UPF0333 family)|nr:hypothetical protein [Candidatus Micrarchaeota archaeon]
MMGMLSNLLQSNKKGQAALEFYIYASAFVFFLGLIGLFFLNSVLTESEQRESELAYEVGGQYADMINFALVAGNGFQGKFYMPKVIAGKEYVTYLGNTTTGEVSGFAIVSFETTDRLTGYSYPLNTKNISGDLKIKSVEIIDHILVNNTKGRIYIQVN